MATRPKIFKWRQTAPALILCAFFGIFDIFDTLISLKSALLSCLALGARRKEVLQAALGRALKLLVSSGLYRMEFRPETFTTFNHAQFFGPVSVNGDISSNSFSQVVRAGAPRLTQVAVKFTF